eukprot:6104535-Amphidinium_carterae.1
MSDTLFEHSVQEWVAANSLQPGASAHAGLLHRAAKSLGGILAPVIPPLPVLPQVPDFSSVETNLLSLKRSMDTLVEHSTASKTKRVKLSDVLDQSMDDE